MASQVGHFIVIFIVSCSNHF